MKKGPSATDPAPRPQRTPRKVNRVEPFSDWQILVDTRRQELSMSVRLLAKAANGSSGLNIAHTTVWAWLYSPSGGPQPVIYDRRMNDRLADALGIDRDRLAEAYEASRRHFILPKITKENGRLNMLRSMFSESKQGTWSSQEIVKRIDDMLSL